METTERVWKSIPTWEGMYEFDGIDQVRSVERTVMRRDGIPQHFKERILRWSTKRNGRQQVILNDTSNGRLQTLQLHQAIWMYFNNRPIPQGHDIHHIDHDYTNNQIDNLQLLTKEEHRILHAVEWTNKRYAKVVQALDKNGNVVKEFPSTAEAGRNGFIQQHVSMCCNGKEKTHKGYRWQYKEG